MSQPNIRFYIYSCHQKIIEDYRQLLKLDYEPQVLDPLFSDNILSSFSLFSEEARKDVPQLITLFPQSDYVQSFVIVPLNSTTDMDKETIEDYHKRLDEEARYKLQYWFADSYQEEYFTKTTAFIWLQINQEEFGKIGRIKKEISRFLKGSDSLLINRFRDSGSLEYVIDGKGIGFKSSYIDITLARQTILSIILVRSYLNVFRRMILKIKELTLNLEQLSLANISAEMEKIITFLIAQYSHEPFLSTQTEIRYLYDKIKKHFNLDHKYGEILEQLKLLRDINDIKKQKEYIKQLVSQAESQQKLKHDLNHFGIRLLVIILVLGLVLVLIHFIGLFV